MKYIVNFSGGLCSFWAAYRCVERYGRENVVLLFADTKEEDAELYEFNAQAALILQVSVITIEDGRDVWQLFTDEGMIGNDNFPICSMRLKREPLNEWMESRFEMDGGQGNAFYDAATVVLGFDWTEEHRVRAFKKEHPTWNVLAPMTEEPYWDKCRMEKEAAKLGLTISTLYKQGFPHNNCGGRCVRAGITHWVHLLKHRPDRFMDWEVKELKCAAALEARGITPLSILKDRRGGVTRNLYLRDLRLRVEAGEQFSKLDWGGCGCGGATKPQVE